MHGHPFTKRFSPAKGSMQIPDTAAGSSYLWWETQIKNQANNKRGRPMLCYWESGGVFDQQLVVSWSPSFLRGYPLFLADKVDKEQVGGSSVESFSQCVCLWPNSALSRTTDQIICPQLDISRLAGTEFGSCFFLKTFWKQKGKRQNHAELLICNAH